MPVLKGLMAKGFAKTVRGVMPSVTNVNNASIACGTWPEEHGITGNSFFDEAKGRGGIHGERRLPPRADRSSSAQPSRGIKSALLTAKKKTLGLLSPGTELAIAAESPSPEAVARYGPAPPIYSREINYWLWEVAIDLLKDRPGISPRLRPHDRLPDAHLAPVGPRVEGAPGEARRPASAGRWPPRRMPPS